MPLFAFDYRKTYFSTTESSMTYTSFSTASGEGLTDYNCIPGMRHGGERGVHRTEVVGRRRRAMPRLGFRVGHINRLLSLLVTFPNSVFWIVSWP